MACRAARRGSKLSTQLNAAAAGGLPSRCSVQTEARTERQRMLQHTAACLQLELVSDCQEESEVSTLGATPSSCLLYVHPTTAHPSSSNSCSSRRKDPHANTDESNAQSYTSLLLSRAVRDQFSLPPRVSFHLPISFGQLQQPKRNRHAKDPLESAEEEKG